ncbi:MAG TPA: hypothetical protein VMZ50_10900, partial [Phycisphaerae bacterium]|nr:hypothetical protein [Phycisphaerae bacterium]
MGMKRILLTALGVLVAATGAAAAPNGDGFTADILESSIDWFAILYALVALAGICVVGFKNSKRT